MVAEPIHPACMCEGGGRGGEGGGRAFYYTYTYSKKKTVLRWSRAGRHCGCRNHVCVREEDARGREAGAHSTTPTYTVKRDSPAREPSWSAFWLQKPSILRACVREEDAGGMEAGAPLDPKMPLENGRADERVSRGQASERAVCVCEAVSVEKGARRPPLPTAVVCPPGRRRRRRLAITAVCFERQRAEAIVECAGRRLFKSVTGRVHFS